MSAGMIAKGKAVFNFARITQIPFLLRRAAGLPSLQKHAFDVENRSHARLASIALDVRGVDYRPGLFVHGVLPRSGTNFLADALALHPHIFQNPGELWEFPLLYVADGARALQAEFQFMFPPNRNVMVEHETLAYLASGWMRHLQKETGERTMLFKSPHLQNIALFSQIFPRDKLLILLRDGRDVLQSSLSTFGSRSLGKNFSTMAHEWSAAVQLALEFKPGGRLATDNALVVRYEDLVQNGRDIMVGILNHCGLEQSPFDWEAFDNLPLRGSSTNLADASQKWQQQPRTQDFNPLGRWRDWSDQQKAEFKKRAGNALIAAGYATNLDW